MAKKKRRRKKVNKGIELIFKSGLFILLVLLITYVLVNFVVRKTVVHNISMQDTLYEGDNILMDKISYRIGVPERYDIICFKSYKQKELLVKRIIGLPGEKVRILAGTIYINGEEIDDVKGLDRIENPGIAADEITLSKDEYFVIGDNREESIDSRYAEIGNVREKEIFGKAAFIIYPFNRFGKIR